MKQAIVVRTDIGMSKGKIAAQAAHASQHALEETRDEKVLRLWPRKGSPKIVLAARDAAHLEELRDEAEGIGLPTALITDDGRTEVKEGTATALGIGPATSMEINQVTRGLSTL